MKKFLLFAFALTTGSFMAQLPVSTAQQNKKVVLEEFTGIHCGYCPDGHRIGTQMYTADPANVVLINIHSGSFANAAVGEPDFKTTEGTAIDGMSGMGITGYPAGAVNREVLVGGVMAAGRGSWVSMGNTIKAQSAYCNVALQGTINPQTRVLTVQVEVYYTATSPVATNSLNVFLLENKIAGIQSNYGTPLYNASNYNANGTYNHNHVLRKALTPTFGLTIPNTSATNMFATTFSYVLPATYGAAGKTTVPSLGNLELVAFVAQSDRNIINASDGPVYITNDAKAVSASLPALVCGSAIAPVVTVENSGLTAITDLTITPSIDGVNGNITTWTGNLAPGATTTLTLNSINASSGGGHSFTYTITGVSGTDYYTINNSAKTSFYSASGYLGTPVAEGFAAATYPPVSWGMTNTNSGPGWSRNIYTGGYNLSSESTKYDFYNNTVIGDKDELILPPMNLSGAAAPDMFFDIAYAQRTSTSDDALDVLVSDNCGTSWTSVYNTHGSSLSTVASLISTAYFPDSSNPSEWRTEQVALTGFNKPNVLVKFVVTSDNGNNLFLDNINLSQSAPVGLVKTNASQVNVALYPNPTNGITNVRIQAKKQSDAKISVVNLLGQVVMLKEVSLTEGTNSVQLDMSDYAGGIYNVTISTTNGSVVKKLNVTK